MNDDDYEDDTFAFFYGLFWAAKVTAVAVTLVALAAWWVLP